MNLINIEISIKGICKNVARLFCDRYSIILSALYHCMEWHKATLTYTEDVFDIPRLPGILCIGNRKIKWRWNIKPLKFSSRSERFKEEKWSIENLTPYCARKEKLLPNLEKCDMEMTLKVTRPTHILNNEDGSKLSYICTGCGDEIFSYDKNVYDVIASEYMKEFTTDAKKQIKRELRRRFNPHASDRNFGDKK